MLYVDSLTSCGSRCWAQMFGLKKKANKGAAAEPVAATGREESLDTVAFDPFEDEVRPAVEDGSSRYSTV